MNIKPELTITNKLSINTQPNEQVKTAGSSIRSAEKISKPAGSSITSAEKISKPDEGRAILRFIAIKRSDY